MKQSKKWLAGAALAVTLGLAASDASAQGALSGNSRNMGATLNLGGNVGTGGGFFRLNPEFHYAFGGRGMAGPAIGLGLDLMISGGFGIGAEGRFAWNFQPVQDLALFVTPYAGLSIGGIFGGGTLFYLGINFGGEVRFVVVDRVFLLVRPLGFTVPITIGEVAGTSISGAGFAWDGAIGGGVTF